MHVEKAMSGMQVIKHDRRIMPDANGRTSDERREEKGGQGREGRG